MQFSKPATQYVTVAASQTTAPVGVIGCYPESVTIIPATTASGAVTILDGSTAIATIPAAAGVRPVSPLLCSTRHPGHEPLYGLQDHDRRLRVGDRGR
jgi:hypothetical protein